MQSWAAFVVMGGGANFLAGQKYVNKSFKFEINLDQLQGYTANYSMQCFAWGIVFILWLLQVCEDTETLQTAPLISQCGLWLVRFGINGQFVQWRIVSNI